MKAALAGARPRPRRVRGRDHPARQAASSDGEAVRLSKRTGDIIELRDAARRGRPRRRPAHLPAAVDRLPPDLRHRRGRERGDGQPGLLRADGPRPDPVDRAAWPARPASCAARSAEVDLQPARRTSASSRCCASLSELPDDGRCSRPPTGRRTRSPRGCASWPAPFHGFYHDCYVMGDERPARADPGPAVAGRGGRDRAAPSASTCSGVDAPDRMDRCERPLPALRCCPTRAVGRAPTVACSIGAAVDTVDLAAEFGTPLFVYDEEHLRARCREAVAAFGPTASHYATKAFLCRAMARLAHEEGMNLDVATGGELHVARPPACRPTGSVLHGNNKSADELARALDDGRRPHRRRLVDELDRIEALVAGGGPTPDGAAPRHAGRRGPHPRVRPHRPGRLQVRLRRGRRARPSARRRAAAAASARTSSSVGIHVHIGSQVFVADFFEQAIEVLAAVRQAATTCPSCRSAAASASPTSRARRHRPSPSGARRSRDACAEAGITAAVTPSRAGPSSPPRPSRSTPWARSRTSPASAPTSRSTAA